MTDSRSPEKAPRPPEPSPPGVQGSSDPEPPSPSEQQAFRRTFLWRFHSPEVITAFRVVGDALCDLRNEAGAWGPKDGLSITWGEIHAACEVLDHRVMYLAEVAESRTTPELV